MINGRTLSFSIITAAMLALCLPLITAAQGSYDPWGRYPDYRRDRDYHDDDYRYGRYDRRYLRDSIHRLDRLSKDFQKDLDRELDRSVENGSRHEDLLNADTKRFRRAVQNLKSRFGDGRNLNRSFNEAQRVLETASHVQRVTQHHFYNRRLASQWSQIRQDLRVIADAYGLRQARYDDPYYRDRDGRYGRRDDDDYRRRYPGNDPWWRRLPFPY